MKVPLLVPLPEENSNVDKRNPRGDKNRFIISAFVSFLASFREGNEEGVDYSKPPFSHSAEMRKRYHIAHTYNHISLRPPPDSSSTSRALKDGNTG